MENRCAELMEWMVRNPEKAIRTSAEISEEQKKKNCIYEGETFKMALTPLLLKPEEHDLIVRVSEIFYRVINKVIKSSVFDREIRKFLTYKDIPWEWMEVEKGYESHAVITRLDALFDGKNLKFLEFNTDNPGGKGWNDIFEEVMSSHDTYREIFSDYNCEKQCVDSLFHATMKSFEDFWGREKEPAVALIEYRESPFLGDPEIVRDYFLSKGVRAALIDARDFTYDGNSLKHNGVEYNTFIRCLKSQEFLDHPEELTGFVSAYLKGHMCMINTFRSLVGSEKSLLALLWNQNFYHYFNDEEIDTIKKYIPPTFRMSEETLFSPDGEEREIREYLIKEQENFVLKPSWGYGGKGVILGRHVPSEDWQNAVREYRGDAAWIAQEYVDVPKIETPVIKETGKVEIEWKYFNINPYVFGGKYAGCLGRISALPVINVAAGGGILPVFVK